MNLTKKDLLDLILLGLKQKPKTKSKTKTKPKPELEIDFEPMSESEIETESEQDSDSETDYEYYYFNNGDGDEDEENKLHVDLQYLKDKIKNNEEVKNDIVDDFNKIIDNIEQDIKEEEKEKITNEFKNNLEELIDDIFEEYDLELEKQKPQKEQQKKYIEIKPNAVYKENLNDLNDFELNFGLDYIKPIQRIKPIIRTKQQQEDDDEINNLLKLFKKEEQITLDDFAIGTGKSSIIQSVLVPKSKFTKKQAINYVKKHFKFKKIDENQRHNFYSFRQFNPTKGSKYSTKILKNGVELVLEYKINGGSLPVNTIYKSIVNGYAHPEIEDIGDGFVYSKNGSDKEIQLYVNEKEKRIIINFIGTYTTFDWSNNLSYVMGQYKKTKRFQRARDAFKKIIDDYSDYEVILVGHSQSAVITHLLNKEFPERIYEVINLNGANLGEKEKDNEYNIRSKMDLVSYLHKPTKRDVIIDNETNNIITEHKPDILKRLKQDREIGR